MIPYGHQSITEEEQDAVTAVLKSGWLTQGPKVVEFEQALSQYLSVPYAIACSNGTSALHAACLSLGVGPGDCVWTSPNSFVASANCALFCGATVDFVDIDTETRNICVTALKEKLVQAQKKSCLPKLIVAVHFAGFPCDMQAIYNLSREYNFFIVEDAAHAIGSHYLDSVVGQCRFSHITTFSFHPVKNMTTGEGGAITTKDEELAHRLRLLCSHGVTREPQGLNNTEEGEWYSEQQLLGFNYRMSDIQAALGLVQLKRLTHFIERRNKIIKVYKDKLSDFPLTNFQTSVTENTTVAWHLFVVSLADNIDRKKVFNYLRNAGVGVNVHYFPIHLQPYYRQQGFAPGMFPNAENYYKQALTLPLFADLSSATTALIVEKLDNAICQSQ